MAWRIGVDSGGTDICLFEDGSGNIAVWKVPSTPADPSRAVAEGVREALAQVAAQASDVSYFGHRTTVATNALIQHRGASTGLITSDGFRDLLEIGRQKRPDLYDLQADKAPVLVERRLRREVPERLRRDGHVETALDEAAVRNAVRVLRDAMSKPSLSAFSTASSIPRMRKRRVASSAKNFRKPSFAPHTRWRPNSANTSGCRRPW
jgi:N-methylhydantoinase A